MLQLYIDGNLLPVHKLSPKWPACLKSIVHVYISTCTQMTYSCNSCEFISLRQMLIWKSFYLSLIFEQQFLFKALVLLSVVYDVIFFWNVFPDNAVQFVSHYLICLFSDLTKDQRNCFPLKPSCRIQSKDPEYVRYVHACAGVRVCKWLRVFQLLYKTTTTSPSISIDSTSVSPSLTIRATIRKFRVHYLLSLTCYRLFQNMFLSKRLVCEIFQWLTLQTFIEYLNVYQTLKQTLAIQ